MSETDLARPYVAKYCEGLGIDIGFGNSAIVPHALTMDLPRGPYCPALGSDKQILRGSAEDLSGFCDCSLNWIYSSHLIEDWLWQDIPKIINEWRRVLKVGGYWITVCPDEPIYRAHCEATGQTYNENHRNPDFTLENFKSRILPATGEWEIVYETPIISTYSWHLVCRKI